MKKYLFEIQDSMSVIQEANDVEEARSKVIEKTEGITFDGSDNSDGSFYVSNGIEVKYDKLSKSYKKQENDIL